MIHDTQRVERIRQAIAKGLKRISALETKVGGTGTVRHQLTQARDHFDDVELNYLSMLGKEERSPQQEARWLDSADMDLAVAITETDVIEKLIDPRGPNVGSTG